MRATWTGSLSMGLLNVPVKAYKAIDDHDVHFRQIVSDGGEYSRVRYKNVSEKSGREVSREEIIKGFEVTEGQIIPVTKEELERIKIKSAQAISIEMFVKPSEIDQVLVEDSQYLAPEKKKPDSQFQLLRTIMERENLIAIGKMVSREREHLVAVRPYGNAMLLQTIAYPDEQRSIFQIDTIHNMKPAKFSDKEIHLATQLVQAMAPKQPDLTKFEDEYTKQVQALIQAKASNQVYTPPVEQVPEAQEGDLAAILQASISKVA